MNPILYDHSETEFRTNGIGMLSDAVSCYVDREINGVYELEMRFPVLGKRFDDIKKRSIILAKPSPYSDPQPFRVYRITKPLRGTVTVYARQIAYDLMGIPVAPFKAANAPAAMQGLSDNAVVDCPFTFSTEKDTVAAMEVDVPKSVWSQLGGSDGSVLDVYGGEYEFDRFNVRLRKRLGEDRGVSIRYGKNMTTLEQDENCANVYTGVYPYWTSADGGLVMLPEHILHAEGNFDHVRIMPLDLSEAFEEPPTESQLRTRAISYMKNNNIGVPDISWTIGFVNLDQTEEYKGKALLEEVHLGDTVTVIFPRMGLNASARAVKTRYDVLKNRYESVTLGKVKANISDTIADNSQKILIESQKRVAADGKLSAELAVQDGKIAAKVSQIGGIPESFGWELLYDSWTLKSNGKDVLKATKDGIDITGKITATSGKIGGFDILSDYLSYNGQTWGGDVSNGIYIGQSGIQCGSEADGVQITPSGKFYAEDGYFRGNVSAGNVQYGGNYGTFSGSGITTSTISGNRLVANTVSTAYTSSGINTSLGRADFAYNVVNGYSQFGSMTGSYLGATSISLNGNPMKCTQISYKDGNGNTSTLNVVVWS